MNDIDQNSGPPLMILFIMLSSILFMGSLTGMLQWVVQKRVMRSITIVQVIGSSVIAAILQVGAT